MRIAKTITRRKAVSKAIANQEVELKTGSDLQLEEAIRLKAYELFLQRGCEHGHDVKDWKTAEQMVRG